MSCSEKGICCDLVFLVSNSFPGDYLDSVRTEEGGRGEVHLFWFGAIFIWGWFFINYLIFTKGNFKTNIVLKR